jgi:hypothetical protein
VSHAEFYEWLFKIGTGWLGWPPAVVLATPIPQLEMAFAGRSEMLRAIFGGSEKPQGAVPLGKKLKAVMAHVGTTKVKRETT